MSQAEYAFEVPPASREHIYVASNVKWEMDRYVDDYLKSRKIDPDQAAKAAVRRCITAYTAPPPFRKPDMDYFLDANLPIVGAK